MPKVQFLESFTFGYKLYKKGEYATISHTQFQLLYKLNKVRLLQRDEHLTLEGWVE